MSQSKCLDVGHYPKYSDANTCYRCGASLKDLKDGDGGVTGSPTWKI